MPTLNESQISLQQLTWDWLAQSERFQWQTPWDPVITLPETVNPNQRSNSGPF